MSVSLPIGLPNPGNYCYINASIQCIKYIEPIINMINNNHSYDTYISKLLTLLNITGILPQPEIKSRVDKILLALDKDGTDDVITKLIQEQNSNIGEFTFLLKKLGTDCNKLYLYVALRDLLVNMIRNDKPINTIPFYTVCKWVTNQYGIQHLVDGRQNDSTEFLMCLFDYLHDSHSVPITLDIDKAILDMPEPELETKPVNIRIEYGLYRDIHSRYSKSYTVFNEELYFYNLSIVKCGKCKHLSFNYSPYNVLCLPIKEQCDQSIYNCLDGFYSREELDKDYKCEKCKNNENNIIEKKILTKPKTLIICLKRFEYKVIGNTGIPIKIGSKIDYPSILNISKYYPATIIAEKENIYRLIGVINHSGMLNFGHYYSYCYDKYLQSWISFNDERVTKIDESSVLNNSAAYLLFYEKITG